MVESCSACTRGLNAIGADHLVEHARGVPLVPPQLAVGRVFFLQVALDVIGVARDATARVGRLQ
jgi:hypothetical protein